VGDAQSGRAAEPTGERLKEKPAVPYSGLFHYRALDVVTIHAHYRIFGG
jgi:hypothetical protein